MKVAHGRGKATLPGELQIWRLPDHDLVALASEPSPGQGARPGLVPMWRGDAPVNETTAVAALAAARAHAKHAKHANDEIAACRSARDGPQPSFAIDPFACAVVSFDTRLCSRWFRAATHVEVFR
jgi:hypothetical protein